MNPEQIDKLRSLLNSVEDDHHAVIQYCQLLVALTGNDDVAGCLDGVNRLVWQIKQHGEAIRDVSSQAQALLHRLANP